MAGAGAARCDAAARRRAPHRRAARRADRVRQLPRPLRIRVGAGAREGFRVYGFMGLSFQGFMGSRFYGFMGLCVYGFMALCF